MSLFIKTFPVGAFQCNCTIIGDLATGEAIVVDPGDEAPLIINELAKKSLKATYLLHTHAHLDHIGATKKVKEVTQAKIGLHKDDLFLYENISMQGELLGLKLDPEVKPVDIYLDHSDTIEWGKDQRVEIIHTPGHTPGSLSFLLKKAGPDQDLLLAGDTLFMGSIGRTDLWGGDHAQIIDSIQSRLLTVNPKTTVICGHGPNTTIAHEAQFNPFLS
jgi:hydroxyacylglutathione hydrolase